MSDKNAVTPARLTCPHCKRPIVYSVAAVLADSESGQIDVKLGFDAEATENAQVKAESKMAPFGFGTS